MGARLGCARRQKLDDRVVAQALLLVEDRLNAHDLQLQELQRLAEEAERSRLEQEAAEQWLAADAATVRIEEAATQTQDLPELGPVWAAWDIAQGRPWAADLEEARRACIYRQAQLARNVAAPSSSSSRTATPRGPRLWERET